MTDDNTKDLTDGEKLDLILERLAKLEAVAEDRARDTRPKLDQIIKEVFDVRTEFGEELKAIRRDVRLLHEDMRNERLARAELGERVSDLEKRPS